MPFSQPFRVKHLAVNYLLLPVDFVLVVCRKYQRTLRNPHRWSSSMIGIQRKVRGLPESCWEQRPIKDECFYSGDWSKRSSWEDGQLQIADELLEVSSYGKRCIYSHWIGVTEPSVSENLPGSHMATEKTITHLITKMLCSKFGLRPNLY